MKNLSLICVLLGLAIAGCDKDAESPPSQTSTDQSMQASKEAAQAAAQDAKQAASEASEAAKQATAVLVDKSKDAAGKAMMAARETTHDIAAATENAAQQVAVSTAPTVIPDWVVMPKYDCRACHAIDHKLVGPAWKDVAEKYKGDPTAEAKLMEKVRKGGKGNWDQMTGGVTMPSHPDLSDADLKRVVDFILSLAKS